MKKILTIAAFVFAGFISSCDRTAANSQASSDLNATKATQQVDKNSVASAKSTDKCQGDRTPGCTCPQAYKPVCGCNGVTYDNGCYAQCDGVTSYTFGTCPSTGTSSQPTSAK